MSDESYLCFFNYKFLYFFLTRRKRRSRLDRWRRHRVGTSSSKDTSSSSSSSSSSSESDKEGKEKNEKKEEKKSKREKKEKKKKAKVLYQKFTQFKLCIVHPDSPSKSLLLLTNTTSLCSSLGPTPRSRPGR